MARKAQIDRASIHQAALFIADADGLQAVTMKSIALRLEVTPMALYRWIGSKEALLDGLVEMILDELNQPLAATHWRDRLHELIHSIRALSKSHPELFLLLMEHPQTSPAAESVRDAIRAELRHGGVPDSDLDHVGRVVTTVVIGASAAEGKGVLPSTTKEALDAEFAEVERMIDWLVDQHRS